MHTFFTLLKKEIRELLTPQMLIPFLVTVLLFFGIGKIVGKQISKQNKEQKVVVLDLDDSTSSREVPEIITKNGIVPTVLHRTSLDAAKQRARQEHTTTVLVLPVGFGEAIQAGRTQSIPVYTTLYSFSILGSRGLAAATTAIQSINEHFGNAMLKSATAAIQPETVRAPIQPENFVAIGSKEIQANPEIVLSFVSSQTTFIPIVLFLVIVLASQMIAVSIASEKENKTLETLLSTPTNRNLIVASKLVGAGIVALGLAVVYMFGLGSYMSGITGGVGNSLAELKPIFSQLGLVLTLRDYTMLGLSLFFGILAALSIAIILGSFAEDTKSAQGVITPIMVLIMIPYFLTLFLDFSSLPRTAQWAIYAIPFAHPFLASQNIFLKNYSQITAGIVYEAVFFLVFVYIAAKLFSSDKILTLKLNFGKKKSSA